MENLYKKIHELEKCIISLEYNMKEINKNLEDLKREIREKYNSDGDCSISKISLAVSIGISTILLAHHFFPTIFSFS